MNVRLGIWLLILLLVILHQDFWFRSDGRLVLGFLPVGFAYHIALTIAAAGYRCVQRSGDGSTSNQGSAS